MLIEHLRHKLFKLDAEDPRDPGAPFLHIGPDGCMSVLLWCKTDGRGNATYYCYHDCATKSWTNPNDICSLADCILAWVRDASGVR